MTTSLVPLTDEVVAGAVARRLLDDNFEILTPDELTRRLAGQRFALDTETTGLHWSPVAYGAHKNKGCASAKEPHTDGEQWADRVVGASIACPPQDVHTYVPFEFDGQRHEDALARFKSWLIEMLDDPDCTVIGHNLKFDLHMLGVNPNTIRANIEDTSVMAHLIDGRGPEDGGYAKSLEALEMIWLGTYRKTKHLQKAGAKKAKDFISWPFALQQEYAGDDAVITYELAWRLWREIKKTEKLEALFRKEMRYLKALWEIERRGVLVDAELVRQGRAALQAREDELAEKLYALAGKRFLWTSPIQLSKVLYDDLGIPIPEPPTDRRLMPVEAKRYTGPRTGSPLLLEHVKHPAGGLVLALRETKKLGKTLETWQWLGEPQRHEPVWERVKRTDPRAIALADRHYSRQKQGAQLGRNCRTRVWLHPSGQAVWCAVWPEPGLAFHGKGDAWECSLFRNEGAGLSSTLIREAVHATVAEWGSPPEGGYITTVDAGKVRRKRDPGRCFLKAGWVPDGVTKDGSKLWFRLSRDTLLGQIQEPQNPVLHTVLNQLGTRTGRLSSSMPNLQNIAGDKRRAWAAEAQDGYEGSSTIREGAYRLRDAIIARPGYTLVRIDHAQQEVRMLGVLSREPRLLDRLAKRADLHLEVAELVWGVRDSLHRTWAKNVTFAVTYGLSVQSLAAFVNTDEKGASRILGKFWQALPGLRPWMEQVQRDCIKEGFVRYFSGRIWRESDYHLAYKSINAVIQGSCADLLSIALLRCHEWLKASGAGAVLLPVHDEILFEVLTNRLDQTVPKLSRLMEVEDLFGIPFITSVSTGHSYGEMTDWTG